MKWACENVSVHYAQEDGSYTVALRDVNLSIRAGERIAIVGPNGSGKSTLALVMAGLISPTSGRVLCDEIPCAGPVGAIVLQSPDDNLIGETVYEELRLCLEQTFSEPEAECALTTALSRFGLDHLADRSTLGLSGGEKQVVALACAMMAKRPLVVLDEPTSHLDPPGKRMFWKLLDEADDLIDPTPAIAVVTQYASEVGHFDRLIAMDAGAIVYDGPPSGWPGTARSSFPKLEYPDISNAPAILSVRNLSQAEHSGWPLPASGVQDVTLTIKGGEAVALCGPIGAGKTTLALLLAGLLPNYLGERHANVSAPVMLLQFPERQMFCKTVEAEVAYGLMMRDVKRSDAVMRAHSALAAVGLEPAVFACRDPFSLSGGQRRRVMLAAAVVLDADLYILDEPQAALDESGIASLRSACAEWLASGASYMLISHDLEFLRSLTARVLVLDRGRLLYDGDWDRLDSASNLMSDIGFESS